MGSRGRLRKQTTDVFSLIAKKVSLRAGSEKVMDCGNVTWYLSPKLTVTDAEGKSVDLLLTLPVRATHKERGDGYLGITRVLLHFLATGFLQ